MEKVMRSEKSNEARLVRFMELANMISVPMSVQAVVRLGVPDAVWQGGANQPLSASDILSRVLPAGTGDAENLQRILRVLSIRGIFTEHLTGGDRKYSLTDLGEMLATDADGLSHSFYLLQHLQNEMMRVWGVAHEAVVDPTREPFARVYGESPYEYYGKRPEMTELMQRAMSGVSVPFMKMMLDGYDGFMGVHRLVDVGGSTGDCLRLILAKFPSVREAINFDLPEVVATAPPIPGVTHVGGDMFKSVPEGDAIFLKWILTAWTDDECKVLMENCYKALPEGGKLIACDPVLPNETDDSHRSRALFEGDIYIMTMYRAKGKYRTQEEFRKLGLSVGFHSFRAIYVDYFTILEFQK